MKVQNKNRNASASAFGWQFQVDVSIFLMIKYFAKFKSMKVEGKKEDIEIELQSNKKIYAQAKSKMNINDGKTGSYSKKLKEVLNSLSDVKDNNAESYIYISNLEPNPLNSNTPEFAHDYITFLGYNELSDKSKKKIDNQIVNLKKNIDKDKLVIALVPFFGKDKENKKKFIIKKVENFITSIDEPGALAFEEKFMNSLESLAFENATCNNVKFQIKKEDVLWRFLVSKLGDSSSISFDKELCDNEDIFYQAVNYYDKVIRYEQENFNTYNKISNLIMKAKKDNNQITSNEFISKYEEEIYNIVYEDNKNQEMEVVEKTVSKIIAKKIFLRNSTIKKVFERANNYGN